MIWLYISALTAGLVMLPPTVMQALERRAAKTAELCDGAGRADGEAAVATTARGGPGWFAFAAFAATMFGASGLLVERFDPDIATSLLIALALGLAAGTLHPEVLARLSRPRPASDWSAADPEGG